MATKIVIEWASPFTIDRKTFKKMATSSWMKVGLRWHKQFAKIHFTKRAYRRYDYTPRKGDPGSGRRFRGSYQWKKLKTQKHTRPLEYYGDAKRRTLGQPRIKAFPKRAEKPLPAGFNRRHPNSFVNMRREITAHTNFERRKLSETGAKHMASRINLYGRRKKFTSS